MQAKWPDFYCRAYSQSDDIADAHLFLKAMNGLWVDLGLTPLKFTNGNHPYLQCARNWTKRLIPRRERGGGEVTTAEGVRFYFLWMPPDDPLAPFDNPVRHSFSYIIPHELGWGCATDLLRKTVLYMDAFWGELNDGRIVKCPSFCSQDSHIRSIPHIAMMNYWGPEYIGVFGGRKLIESAGFHSVMDHHRGVVVYVGPVRDLPEFERRQHEVEGRLEEADIWSVPPVWGGDSVVLENENRFGQADKHHRL